VGWCRVGAIRERSPKETHTHTKLWLVSPQEQVFIDGGDREQEHFGDRKTNGSKPDGGKKS
jgi:hypothetical protein